MEKTGQEKVEYMSKLWIDTRLTEEEMKFLWDACSVKHKESFNSELAGNISKSELLKDKDNWFYESVLKPLTEKMFYRENNNYYKYHVEKEEPLPKFEMDMFWVNYQKQYEFNPIHDHNGGRGFSFVVFMKIPTHWKEQHALPISANSNAPLASSFVFVKSEKDSNYCENINFQLSPDDEGRILFFPAWLQHMVYPFYECEKERVTISGNIALEIPNKQEVSVDEYEEKKKIFKMMENTVKITKKELKQMKKEREKEGLN